MAGLLNCLMKIWPGTRSPTGVHAHTNMHGLPRDESLQACCRGHSLESLGTPVKSVLTLSLALSIL